MSKKKVHAIAGKDGFCRMNFLYQASMLLAGQNNTLSSYYGRLCRIIGKKTLLRCDPELKRNICKRCYLAQEPGITAELEIEAQPPNTGKRRRRRKKNNHPVNIDENAKVILKCMQCKKQRSYRINSNYSFWLENPESIAEVCSLGQEETTTTTNNNQSILE